MFAGSCAGHAIGTAIANIVHYGFQPVIQHSEMHLIIPIVLGILLYTRFFPSVAWLKRLSVAFPFGAGIGQTIYASPRSQVMNQAMAAMVTFPGDSLGDTLNSLISIVALLAVLTHFLFTVPQTKFVEEFSQVGRCLMMATFCVRFGNVVSGRLSVLLGELLKIFRDRLGMI